ncbi:MAG: hypothetical protein ACHQ03_11760 [Candidatus Bathyarchaeia archaeon]
MANRHYPNRRASVRSSGRSSPVRKDPVPIEFRERPVYQIQADDVLGVAKEMGVPPKKIDWHIVQKAIESYSHEGSYSVWNAIKDGIKEGLKNQ